MTNPPGFGAGDQLTFNSPLSGARADRLAGELAARRPATVTDLGCGWGELLLRVVAAAPGARGTGVDHFGPDMERAAENAARHGLTDRVTFVEGEAADHTAPADVVISIGAYQAFGTIPEALAALRTRVNPGGRVLFAAEIWEYPPSAEQLANMWPGMTIEDCLHLPDLVDAAVAAGFRPLRIETSNRDEWEEFESRFLAGTEEWLLANPGHPEAESRRERADAHRRITLRGARGVLGFAFLLLGVPVAAD